MKRNVTLGTSAALIGAITVMGVSAAFASSPTADTAKKKKPPKVGAILQAQADISPVEDYVAFNTGIFSSARACALRPVKIQRGAAVIDTVPTVDPYKSGKKWAAGGQGEFRKIDGYITRGETLRATIAAKKTKSATCKAKSISFVVP